MTRSHSTAATVVFLLVLAACQRSRLVYEVPTGYVGWVHVSFGGSCQTDHRSLFGTTIEVASDGTACSGISSEARTTLVRVYYINSRGDRVRELRSTGWGEGGMYWAPVGSVDGKSTRFFVGTEEQLEASWKAGEG